MEVKVEKLTEKELKAALSYLSHGDWQHSKFKTPEGSLENQLIFYTTDTNEKQTLFRAALTLGMVFTCNTAQTEFRFIGKDVISFAASGLKFSGMGNLDNLGRSI